MSDKSLSAPLIATASAADPFYTIRDVLEGAIRDLQISCATWQSLLQSSNTATDAGFRVKHDEFQRDLTKCEDSCKKLKTAIANMEKNRSRYPHVDDRELERRKGLVAELDSSLMGMRNVFYGRETKSKLEADQRKELHVRAAADTESAARAANSYTKANSGYIGEHNVQQQQIRREQDEALGSLSGSLSRVNEMAVTISSELKEQDVILDDIDRSVDATQGKMDSTIKHVEKLLKTKDKCQLMTICILVLVFIILAVVSFYILTK